MQNRINLQHDLQWFQFRKMLLFFAHSVPHLNFRSQQKKTEKKMCWSMTKTLNFIENGFVKYNIPLHYFLPIKRTKCIRYFIECWYLLVLIWWLIVYSRQTFYTFWPYHHLYTLLLSHGEKKPSTTNITANLICVWKSVGEYGFFSVINWRDPTCAIPTSLN